MQSLNSLSKTAQKKLEMLEVLLDISVDTLEFLTSLFFKKGTFDKGSSKKTFSIKLLQCFESINQSNLVGLLLLKAGPQIDDQY